MVIIYGVIQKEKKWNHKVNVKPEIDDLDKFFKHSINCAITSSGYRDQTVNEEICLNFQFRL